MDELLQALRARDPRAEWEIEPDTMPVISCEGESADGVPSWHIWRPHDDAYVVQRVSGWYSQEGDADGVDGVLRLMAAMDAAHAALDAALEAARLREVSGE